MVGMVPWRRQGNGFFIVAASPPFHHGGRCGFQLSIYKSLWLKIKLKKKKKNPSIISLFPISSNSVLNYAQISKFGMARHPSSVFNYIKACIKLASGPKYIWLINPIVITFVVYICTHRDKYLYYIIIIGIFVTIIVVVVNLFLFEHFSMGYRVVLNVSTYIHIYILIQIFIIMIM
jgi:hypothetical protein